MTTFKKYGGMAFAPKNNITKSLYATSSNQQITDTMGEENSQLISKSHINMTGSSLLDVQAVFFTNQTHQNTAFDVNQTGVLHVNLVKPLPLTNSPLYLSGENNGVIVNDSLTITRSLRFPGSTKPLVIHQSFFGTIPMTILPTVSTSTFQTTPLPILIDFDYQHVFLTLECIDIYSCSVNANCCFFKPSKGEKERKYPLSIFISIAKSIDKIAAFKIHFLAIN